MADPKEETQTQKRRPPEFEDEPGRRRREAQREGQRPPRRAPDADSERDMSGEESR
jgi:hypothetical protein